MRHQYTPVFREFTTSSVWAQDSDTRIVWLWMLLTADPEGYVPAAIPGIALAANVSLEAAQKAVAVLEAPDPFSRSKEHEGRRIEPVPGGWRILNFLPYRELAKAEAAKARKRAWQKAHRAEQLILPHVEMDPPVPNVYERLQLDSDRPHLDECGRTVAPNPENVDAPKPKPKSSSPKKEKSTPLPPVVEDSIPVVLHRIPDDWQLGEELLAEAKTLGIERPLEWFEKLRRGPIGGTRGVFTQDLAAYVRGQFPKWRTWEETDRAKALSSAASGTRSSFAGADGGQEPPKAKRLPGLPGWVNEAHAKFAKEHTLNLRAEAKSFAGSYHLPLGGLRPADVFRPFMEYLERRASKEVA